MLRFVAVLGICLALAGCASPPASSDLASFNPRLIAQQSRAQLPLIYPGKRQWRVRVMVDGEEGVFVVDTGSEATIITPQFAKRIGIPDGSNPSGLFGHDQIELTHTRFAKLTYLKLGGLLYLDFYAPVLNLDHISRETHAPIDGILGNNVLRKTACTIDWRNNLLTLDAEALPRPADAIAVTVRDNRLFFTAKINGQDTEFMLDTGAYCSSLTEAELQRLKIPAAKKSRLALHEIDIDKSRPAMQTRVMLDRFELGKINRANLPVLEWDHTVVGMDVLDSCILVFDARAGWMVLKPY